MRAEIRSTIPGPDYFNLKGFFEKASPTKKRLFQALFRIGTLWQAAARKNATQLPRVDTGALRDSLKFFIRTDGEFLSMEFGSFGVKYAAIQEYGGPIVPINGKYLTIPASRYYKKYRARELKTLVYVKLRDGQPFLYDERRGKPAYWLRKKVMIREKAYIRRAIKTIEPRIMDILSRAIVSGDK